MDAAGFNEMDANMFNQYMYKVRTKKTTQHVFIKQNNTKGIRNQASLSLPSSIR